MSKGLVIIAEAVTRDSIRSIKRRIGEKQDRSQEEPGEGVAKIGRDLHHGVTEITEKARRKPIHRRGRRREKLRTESSKAGELSGFMRF